MPTDTRAHSPANHRLALNDGWFLRSEELEIGPDHAAAVLGRKEGWMPHPVPGDIRQTLIAHGLLPEPLEGTNCLDQDWVERKSWWFKKQFDVSAEFLDCDVVELAFESLDCDANVWINGHPLGRQQSVHYPFVRDVRPFLVAGENTLLVRLTTGNTTADTRSLWPLKRVQFPQGKSSGIYASRGDRRRPLLRKPQFCFGWDWAPRLATCAIAGDVTLSALRTVVLRSIHPATTALSGNAAELQFDVEIDNLALFATIDARLELNVQFQGETIITQVRDDVLLKSGTNVITFTATVQDAQLWWPNGAGRHVTGLRPLYTAEVTVSACSPARRYPVAKPRATTPHVASARTRFGIRTVKLCTDRINAEERGLAFQINGVRVFCKGANWVPADSLPARIPADKYRHLVEEAAAANFNMLRMWGGGIYEPEVFYERCDELGIMVWQDYMFACDIYPDHLEWFRREAELEIEYQTKRLRAHPCITLWCGNNEAQSGFLGGYFGGVPMPELPCFGGAHIYNHLAPKLARQLAPEIPYWNSSPYGGEESGQHLVGDNHLCYHDIDLAVFDSKAPSHFASEFGCLGPIPASSWRRATGLAEPALDSREWQLHTNTYSEPRSLSIRKSIEFQYGIPVDAPLTLEEFTLYGGLAQGRWYQRAIHTFRARPTCGGSLFWMYADCWGEIGWTILDYYSRRKISFPFVARAYAPVSLILRKEGDRLQCTLINDTATAWNFPVEFGWMRFDGSEKRSQRRETKAAPYSRQVIAEFPAGDCSSTDGFLFSRVVEGSEITGVVPAVLLPDRVFECRLPEPKLTIAEMEEEEGDLVFRVSTDVFAHGVHFNLSDDARPSDQFFDLMPGESRLVRVSRAEIPAGGVRAASVRPPRG